MITEFAIIFSFWTILGLLLKAVTGLPLLLTVPLALGLLIAYEAIFPKQGEKTADERLSINSTVPAMQNLFWLFIVFVVDIGAFLFTIYVESTGAKIAFAGHAWPREIMGLLQAAGTSGANLSPAIIWGVMSSLAFLAGTFTIIRYGIGILGTIQRMKLRGENDPSQNRVDLISTIQPLAIAGFLVLLIYGVLAPWIIKIGRLAVGKILWPAEFEAVFHGDAIVGSQRAFADLSSIMNAHQGEFSTTIVRLFPIVLLAMHLIAALLSEVYLLHAQTTIGQLEARHAMVIRTILGRLRGTVSSERGKNTDLPEEFHGRTSDSTLTQASPSPLIQCAQKEAANQLEMIDPEVATPDEVPVEERPHRVFGGSETVTPRMAMDHPDQYVVVRENSDTNETLYRIQTLEYHAKNCIEED